MTAVKHAVDRDPLARWIYPKTDRHAPRVALGAQVGPDIVVTRSPFRKRRQGHAIGYDSADKMISAFKTDIFGDMCEEMIELALCARRENDGVRLHGAEGLAS